VSSPRFLSRCALVILCGVLGGAVLLPRAAAQTTGKPESYNATAVNMGSGPGMAGRVLVTIDRWSSAADRDRLLTVLRDKGPDKLLDALQDNAKVGYIRLPNTLAWDLRYAFEAALPEGGRRVVLATDRPIGMQEARNQPRTIDYPFTMIEIRFDKSGVGVGKMSVYSKITLSKDKRTIELENYDIEPVRLTEVRIDNK